MPKKRSAWTEGQMAQALTSIRNGMATRTAAKEFGIPRRTLRSHVLSGETSKKIGRPSYLTPQQESELCGRIFRLAEVGMPITSKVIRRSVYEFCQKNSIPTPFENKGIAGRKWLSLFLARHPDVARRKCQFMNPARAAKLNRFIVNDYFEKLKAVLLKLDILERPQCIFNIDEKGCRLNLHKAQQVFARKGAKRVHLISQEHAENVSIVACGNALGQIIPPMILFKGKRKKEEWVDNLPPGSTVEMTDKGSMTTSVFIKWVHHFAKFKPPGKVLLIFDGASSHLDAGIVDVAESYGIILFCLPSNTTHELQPMDKSVFKAFESYWDDEVMAFWTNKPDRVINKFTFGQIFSKVWPKATSTLNITSGFKATGIYPYDPSVIPDIAFAPSEITQKKLPLDNVAAPSTFTTISSNKIPVDTAIPSTSKTTTSNRIFPDDSAFSTSKAITYFVTTSTPKKTQIKKKNIQDSSSSDSSDDNFSVHDSSSTEEEASVSFTDVLITPDLKTKKTVTRKKSLNYRALEVTKALFLDTTLNSNKTVNTGELKNDGKKNVKQTHNENDKLAPGPSGSKLSIKAKCAAKKPAKKQNTDNNNNSASKCGGVAYMNRETWFCYLCGEDEVKDMRLCGTCKRYVHEECVGLTANDKNMVYVCPECE